MSEAPILYHAPFTRSGTVRVLLEELGIDFELRPLKLHEGEHKRPEYLAKNPMGKVPMLEHRGTVVTETAAICLYLCDAFPKSGLAPALDDPKRGTFLRWLMFAPGPVEMALVDAGMKRDPGPARRIGYGSMAALIDGLEAAFTPGPWVLGDRFSGADVVLGGGLGFAVRTGAIEPKPAAQAFVDRYFAREPVQRAIAADKALAKELGQPSFG